jgi:hypothetical protein
MIILSPNRAIFQSLPDFLYLLLSFISYFPVARSYFVRSFYSNGINTHYFFRDNSERVDFLIIVLLAFISYNNHVHAFFAISARFLLSAARLLLLYNILIAFIISLENAF